MLNSDQQLCFDDLIQKNHGCFLLKGFAGTGKTYLAKELIKVWLQTKKVIALAPTHQAKLQLKGSFVDISSHQLNFSTVASFLKVERTVDKITGEEMFTDPHPDFDIVDRNTVIIVDETSMLTRKYISSLVEFEDVCTVLFLGDFEQIPPVKEKTNEEMFKKYECYELTIQQRNAGEILKLCNSLRTSIKLPEESSTDIIIERNSSAYYNKLIKEITNSHDPYSVSYLAFTNKAVNYIRNKIQYSLYKNSIYNLGQYIRLDKPCEFATVGEIFVITKIEEKTVRLFDEFDFDGFSLDIVNVLTGVSGNVTSLTFDDQDIVLECAREMYNENYKNHSNYMAVKNDFMVSVDEKERLLEIWLSGVQKVRTLEDIMYLSSPYSLTIHKSQGRTIDTVFLDAGNVLKYKNDISRNLLYVGASRTKRKLYIKR